MISTARLLKTPGIRTFLQLFTLVLVSFAVFGPALRHDFLINWDDRQYVLDNPLIQGLSLEHLRGALTTFHLGNYAPLHLISYMLDYELWGMKSFGFILGNLTIHAVNGVLFYLLLRRLVGEKVWIFAAALLFLVHPVQVESVVWISERKNLLSMTFFLVSWYCYLRYRSTELGRGTTYYWVSLFAFVLAMLTKSVTVVLPLVLILHELCCGEKRQGRGVLVDKIPYFLVAALFAALALKSHAVAQGGITSFHGGSPAATFFTMLTVLMRYLGFLAWPAQLSAFYDIQLKPGVDQQVAWAALSSLALCVFGFFLYRRRRKLFFWYALFFVGLIPVSQIVPIVTLMNDRYLYFPMLGAAAFVCAALLGEASWEGVFASRRSLVTLVLILVATGGFAAAASARVPVWQDSYTLWKDASAKAPRLALTHDAYGEGLLQRGRFDEAINEFQMALSLERTGAQKSHDPNWRTTWANTRNNLGTAYGMKGWTDQAIDQFVIALKLDPDLAKAHFNLGNALMNKGQAEAALRSFSSAVRLNPGNPAFQANLRQTREIVESRAPQAMPGGPN
ncbi:membrane protein [Geomonas limicola]|uniref:Membrane protein n=1 Tax=Geomonas limicola TaxID=2740186 RepID=A0A6V8ND02_9BACT|nr:tetratricopeptide repeat protein [Geomonas limicola]GFO70411.1 membrane protein [Geomonas limicola]